MYNEDTIPDFEDFIYQFMDGKQLNFWCVMCMRLGKFHTYLNA